MSTQDRISVVLDIGGDVSNLQAALNKVQNSLKGFNSGTTFSKEMTSDLQDAQKALDKLKQLSKKDKITLVDQKEVEKAFKTYESAINRLAKQSKTKDIGPFDTQKGIEAKKLIDNLSAAMDKYQQTIKSVRETEEERHRTTKAGYEQELAAAKALEKEAYKKATGKEWSGSGAKALASREGNEEFKKLYEERLRIQKDYQNEKIRVTQEEINQNEQVVSSLKEIDKVVAQVGDKFPQLAQEIKGARTPEEIERIVTKLREIGMTDAAESMHKVTTAIEESQGQLPAFNQNLEGTRTELEKLNATGKDIDQLRNRLMYFFGIGNTIQLFKRSIRSAYNTLKDLDEVMTETAVVTKFDISDMWAQLPTYVQRANELGLTIHDVYESMTLFYQQGLNTTEATELSTQALKMARIAGLDAATAVDRVTNALRGFNMELNEASATNIADVYSKLAAITASNVDEISTAMTKVASLANNANMSFENTAAFLAQIIESTRESAETAGTALKTVIARFSEVKKLYSEGDLLGTDEEGEGIDVNRISTALRTAGINLNEYLTGMKGLDEIFMELAEKWDGLSIVQQRYIATQAAGSRQQSRFIALMSDYQRTLELTTAAENAAGASQEQYEKTLESVESKLNQLKNAWNEFTMGIMNSGFLKAVIDFARNVLNAINAITGKLPGLLKSVANLGVIFGGLKLGKSLLFGKHGLIGQVTTMLQGKEVQGLGITLVNRIYQGFIGGSSKISKSMAANLFDNVNRAMATKTKEFARIQAEYNASWANGSLGMQQYNKMLRETTAAEAAYNAVLAETGLTQEAFTAVESLSLSNKEKALVLTGLQTGAITSEDIATKDLTKDQLLEMLATKGVAGAKKALIADRLKSIAIMAAEKLGIDLFFKSTMRQTIAETALAKAIGIKNAQMLISLGYIALIIAAIAGLVAIIYICIKAAKDQTVAAQLKKTEERLEKLNDALNDTKEAIDDLKSAVDTFDDLQDKVSKTIKGTREWRDAVTEANQQVLDLAEKYPELAGEITYGENGQLTFNDGALDAFYEKQVEQLAALQNIYTTTLGIKDALTDKTIVEEVTKILGESSAANEEEAAKLAELLATGVITGNMWTKVQTAGGPAMQASDELKEIAEANGISNIEMYLELFMDNMDLLYDWWLVTTDKANDYAIAIESIFANNNVLANSGLKDAV